MLGLLSSALLGDCDEVFLGLPDKNFDGNTLVLLDNDLKGDLRSLGDFDGEKLGHLILICWMMS